MANKYKVIAASVPTLIALSVTLFLAVLVLAALYVQERNQPSIQLADSTPVVSLGIYDYEIEDGKATRIESESNDKLRDLLVEKADKAVSTGCSSAYYTVSVMSDDKSQALVKYGCQSPDSPMHVKYADNEWKAISPTSKFDNFGIPECEYVNENELSVEVAPVCHQIVEERAVYTAR